MKSRYGAVTAALFSASFGTSLHARDNGTMIYDFAELTASPELNWKPCFDNFTCTILEVPLDYADPSIGTTGIAFIKHSSENPNAEDILPFSDFPSGGPGVSGVSDVLVGLEAYVEKLGFTHNIVGFDPRGVNNSGPSVSCFPNDPVSRNIFYERVFTGVDNSSESTLIDGFQRAGAFGEWCSAIHTINGTARYANTVAVANDMIRYIETKAKTECKKPEEAKLWFYGVSWGTVLAATYATLFPDRIARIIVDGVVDSEDYYAGGWTTALSDTDNAVRSFFRYCFEAGPELCAFHKDATSAEELEQRYLAIHESLKESPIEVADPSLNIPPVTITWQDVASILTAFMYTPMLYFENLALILSDLEQRNGTLMALMDGQASLTTSTGAYDDREVRSQTTCFDSNGRFNTSTLQEYKEHVALMNNQSFYGGPTISAVIGTICRSLDTFPPESQVFSGKPGANKTSTPMLFIGNIYDPVTPLRSAKKMSSLFAGSRVLTLNATGHDTLGVASKCINDYTKAYIANATLPPPDIVCAWDDIPFLTSSKSSKAKRSVLRRPF